MNADRQQQVMELVHQVGNRFVAVEKEFVFEHEGIRLHASEIHLMDAVAGTPGINPTAIAERLNITKGAVSQTLARLEKKNIIRRDVDPTNNAALNVTLTPFGDDALTAFRRKFDAQWSAFSDYVDGLCHQEYQVVLRFLSSLKGFLNNFG
ncbi:MAG: MarR family transcriptional regulator [Rhodospirillales bacterium]|nr:MarR family transcriptional regulator [Rhodospirillales bacterium]